MINSDNPLDGEADDNVTSTSWDETEPSLSEKTTRLTLNDAFSASIIIFLMQSLNCKNHGLLTYFL
jgi:hypothetical protein